MLLSTRLAWISLAAVLAGLSSGCFLNSSAYENAGAGAASSTSKSGGAGGSSGGQGGGTGGGSAAGGSGGAGGSTTTSTTTTTTTKPECMAPGDCPQSPDNCHQADCTNGKCGLPPVTDGTPCGSGGDACHSVPTCQSGACTPQPLPDGTICGIPAGVCWGAPTCQTGMCQLNPLPGNTVLNDDKGGDCQRPMCDGQGNLTHIADNLDAPPSNFCADKTCVNGMVQSTSKNDGQQGPGCGGLGKCCSGHCCDIATCLVCAY